ncbi:MAG: hypothetical protein QNI99_10550 [Woeseiaceae bacterium]|nr:hypothetical protein [Woeseiaceae bacterium]
MTEIREFLSFLRFVNNEYQFVVVALMSVLIIFYIFPPRQWIASLRGTGGDAPSAEGLLAEADFYMAYEQYDEAAKVLRRSMSIEEPTAEVIYKLLQALAAMRKSDDFLYSAQYYMKTFGRHGHWDDICELGRQLLPDQKLFR